MIDKYDYIDVNLECPFGTIHQKSCNTCKLAIKLISNEEIAAAKKEGDIEVENRAYACSITAILTELQKLNKKMSKIKKVSK